MVWPSSLVSPPPKYKPRRLISPVKRTVIGLHGTPQRRPTTTPILSLTNNNADVKVVVRIRPLNEEEERRGSKSVLYCLQQDEDQGNTHSRSSSSSNVSLKTASMTSSSSSNEPSPLSLEESSDDPEATPLAANCNRKLFAEDPDNEPADDTIATVSFPTACYSETCQRTFDFDAVYGPETTQSDLYQHAISDSISNNLYNGFNTTILAYGMTGSGKTYTMSPSNGIIGRAVSDLFEGRRQAQVDGKHVTITMSCLEIYTEDLFDLLNTDHHNDGNAQQQHSLKLRDHGESVTVSGLQTIKVDSVEEVRALLQIANQQRTVGQTKLNERSSRSHAITTLHVVSAKDDQVVRAKLTLVDLAGSERIKQSGVEGTQRKESIHINTDLFVLGKVVHSLSTGQPHIPYRDSKLTRLLRDALGGNCRTTLIACVSPSDLYADESIHTLRYAERTQSIRNSAHQNVLQQTLTPAQCAALQAENRILKTRIADILQGTAQSYTESLGLGELQAKLSRAQQEARFARDNVELVTEQASRLKGMYEKLLNESGVLDEMEPFPDEPDSWTKCLHTLVQEFKLLGDEMVLLAQQLESKPLMGDDTDNNDTSPVPCDLEERLVDLSEMLQTNHASLQETVQTLVSNTVDTMGDLTGIDDGQEPFQVQQQLYQDMEFVNSENDILRQQNKKLQEEVQRLKEQLEKRDETTAADEARDDKEASGKQTVVEQKQQQIRSHAEQLLHWADKAIQKGKRLNDSCESSMVSTIATDFKPTATLSKQPPASSRDDTSVLISNLENLRQKAGDACLCQRFLLTSQPEHVEFYLPKLRVMCNCNTNSSDSVIVDNDPCLLVNILRDWQVEFLKAMGLCTASDLVRAITTRAKSLSKEMRQWRREQGLLSVRTKSCGIALHIWARTCKAVMRAVRENNVKNGRPSILDISLMSDDCTVSTLGFCGSIVEGRRLSDVEELASNLNSTVEI